MAVEVRRHHGPIPVRRIVPGSGDRHQFLSGR
jgi:hypothetical protein